LKAEMNRRKKIENLREVREIVHDLDQVLGLK